MNSQVFTQTKSLEYYLQLKYPITLYPEVEGGYVAKIADLPGCLTQGETLEETIDNINEARELWIETVYESGREVPLPSTEDTENELLSLKISKPLYRQLNKHAKQNGSSLEQYAVSVLTDLGHSFEA